LAVHPHGRLAVPLPVTRHALRRGRHVSSSAPPAPRYPYAPEEVFNLC
jgi:hypothetical protein